MMTCERCGLTDETVFGLGAGTSCHAEPSQCIRELRTRLAEAIKGLHDCREKLANCDACPKAIELVERKAQLASVQTYLDSLAGPTVETAADADVMKAEQQRRRLYPVARETSPWGAYMDEEAEAGL